MRFELIDRAKNDFPVQRLCRVLGVNHIGDVAWRARRPSRRQREDIVMLCHVRSAFFLSDGIYGSPRMTCELRDQGLAIGRRRAARLMRDNGLRARQKRRFKRTTDNEHAWPIAPNILDQDFSATNLRTAAAAMLVHGTRQDGRNSAQWVWKFETCLEGLAETRSTASQCWIGYLKAIVIGPCSTPPDEW